MPKLSRIEGAELLDERGRGIGRVDHGLFHPTEPRPVGLQVRRPRLLRVIPRGPLFVPLGLVGVKEGELTLLGRVPSRTLSEREAGFEWDATVIWVGMPVRTPSGAKLGIVRDAGLALKAGRLDWLAITGGPVTDLAVGGRRVEGEDVRGFDGAAVVVEDSVLARSEPGGLAAAAGKGAAHAKVGAEQMAAKAAGAAAAAVRLARRSDAGRKAGRFLGSLKKSVIDAMRDDEEE